MGTQVTYLEDLPEIGSEFIEPYAQRFFMMQLESIYYGLITPCEAKQHLNSVGFFISSFCGIHARIATSNIYDKFCNMTDDEIITICKKTFEK